MEPNQTNQQAAMPVVNYGIPAEEYYIFILKNINIAFIAQAFSLFGVFSNIINITIYARLGFNDTINTSLFGLAVCDFGACFLMCFKAILQSPWFEQALNFPYQTIAAIRLLLGTPSYVFSRITTAITAFIAFERCLCVAMPLKVKSLITKRTVTCFLVITYTLCAMTAIPVYYTQNLAWKFDPSRNKSVLVVIYAKNTREIETMFYPFYTFFSVGAMAFIVVCTAILVINLKRKASWRKSVTSTANKTDDVSSKEKRISKMVSIVSSLFIVCFSPKLATLLWAVFDKNFYNMRSVSYKILNVYVSFALLLEVINSSVNIFIYYKNSSKYREMFDKIFHRKVQNKDDK